MATSADIDIYRGTDLPVTVEFYADDPPTTLFSFPADSYITLLVTKGNKVLFNLRSDQDASLVFTEAQSKVVWTPGVSESMRVPQGTVAVYELHYVQTDDTRLPLCDPGHLVGIGGG